MASRNFTKHCFLATWIFDIRNLDYFERAGQENHGFRFHSRRGDTQRHQRPIKIRLHTLLKDSRARQIAEVANDDRAKQLYADGHSLAEVGKQLGVEASTVGRR